MAIDDETWRDEIASEAKPKRDRGPLRVVTEVERRPDVILGADTHDVTTAMVSALRVDPELFVRGGALTHVIRADDDDAFPGALAGSPVARPVPISYLADRVSLHARCLARGRKKDDEGWSHVPPPIPRVRAVHELGSWQGFRQLRGIVEAPTLRPDGTVIQEPGHDRATGYLYIPSETFEPVPDEPTHSDAVLAYAHLSEPFRDFPYVDEAHRSAVIAAVLTLLARPAITGATPAWVFDASTARSGKSLQVDVVNLIASGRPASRTTFPETDEELEKVLAGYAMRSASVINFDNVARTFGGAALDKVITAIDQVDLRVLGSSQIATFDWRAVLFASGNNVRFKGDMAPRVLSPRLETPHDNPEQRTDLLHADLRAWVGANRPRLVRAALTILRAYAVAGRPDQGCPRWGGFESWSRLIPHALVWVGAPDPMGARRGLEGDDDPERVYQAAFVDGWRRMCDRIRPEGMTVKEALAILYPPRSSHDPAEPDGFDDLREAVEALTSARPGAPPASKRVGDVLARLKARPVGGRRLMRTTGHNSVSRWLVR